MVEEDETECSICSATEDLVSHHISYVSGETIPLCRSCHGKVHMGDIDSIPAPTRKDRCTLTGADLDEVKRSPNVHLNICNATDICPNRNCPFFTDDPEDIKKWIDVVALESFVPWANEDSLPTESIERGDLFG